MNPDEIEFLAEASSVNILPKFRLERLHLIVGDVGPFEPNKMLKVPIWLAINLKQRQKCTIVPPHWMCLTVLEDIKELEKTEQLFTQMPSEFYMVETKLLLGCASADIPDADEIRTIIKDISDIRIAKLRRSMDYFMKAGGGYARMDNITLQEINAARPLLPHALDQLARLSERQQRRIQNSLHTNTL